jgi:hypothetical protein
MEEIGGLYARKEGTTKMLLIKQLMNLRYRYGTLVVDHVNVVQYKSALIDRHCYHMSMVALDVRQIFSLFLDAKL